jgi:glycosyltransferase involved in cell wall biosynthesis
MVEAIERILANEELREQMISAGKRHTRHFRSEVTAYGIMKCYERIGIEIET